MIVKLHPKPSLMISKHGEHYMSSLDGKSRSKETFVKYPQFKIADVCIAEMALILIKEKQKMMENAKCTWDRLFNQNEFSHLAGSNVAKILHAMVKNECKNGEESYEIQVSQTGQITEGRKEKKQPFIYCGG